LPYLKTCLNDELTVCLLADKGEQRDVPGIFNCFGNDSLMFCAGTRLTSRSDLAGFINVPFEQFDVLVINIQIFAGAKLAYFRSSEVSISLVIGHVKLLFA
jgi:hypothetical protein